MANAEKTDIAKKANTAVSLAVDFEGDAQASRTWDKTTLPFRSYES